MTIVCRTVSALRAVQAELRQQGKTSALVPTMGALHAGHLSLVSHAGQLADSVIATIFVNPTQFAPNEDLDRYPRQEAEDLQALEKAGVKAVFIPSVDEMYGADDATSLAMTGPALGLEAEFRPHFFGGVATVVSRLLLAAMCDVAVFGEKDYQQLLVIKRMVADLKIPCTIHGSPTVREADGLALSSRNAYLNADERQRASQLHQTLCSARDALQAGQTVSDVVQQSQKHLSDVGFRVDYFALRDQHSLAETTDVTNGRLLCAAWMGSTRLIDNIAAGHL